MAWIFDPLLFHFFTFSHLPFFPFLLLHSQFSIFHFFFPCPWPLLLPLLSWLTYFLTCSSTCLRRAISLKTYSRTPPLRPTEKRIRSDSQRRRRVLLTYLFCSDE